MTDKVLAELARRKELAAKATAGRKIEHPEFSKETYIDSVTPEGGVECRAFFLPADMGCFLADSGTHRRAELGALAWVYQRIGSILKADAALNPHQQVKLLQCQQTIERAILGTEGDKGDG